MEREQHRDEFIRKLMGQQGPEKAPSGFTDRVMDKLQAAGSPKQEPIFSPMTWGAIFLGAAALVATMFLVDIPFIDRLFSSNGIQKMSFDLFSYQFYDSFVLFFKELNINATAIMIVVATISLVIIERLISKKRSEQAVMMM